MRIFSRHYLEVILRNMLQNLVTPPSLNPYTHSFQIKGRRTGNEVQGCSGRRQDTDILQRTLPSALLWASYGRRAIPPGRGVTLQPKVTASLLASWFPEESHVCHGHQGSGKKHLSNRKICLIFPSADSKSGALSADLFYLGGWRSEIKKPLKPIWGCKISLKKFLMFWRISIFSCTGVQHGSLQFLLKLNLNACWAVHVRHQGLFFHMFSCPFWVSVVPGLWRAGGTGGLFCWNAVLCFKAVFIRDKNSTTDIIRLSNIRPKY